ncbi:YhgE/Pip domain-containing protein [Thomasclavelia cocleata]|uniref:YhgE/Pip domain-containing protein n=1 Tax=Thomasclavelia cocleata TaxID=69824 RepID=UPI00248B2972|nr:YhgE/Pip domain-containing protein [Thomasclavelia cocleata]
MIKKEWSAFLKNWWLIIVAIAIIAIPSIYSGVFLGSIWDPYGNTGEIPVAVVNEDHKVTYNDATLDIGKELANNLQNNDSMSFNLVNASKAKQGLEDGDYYMIITIPSDFSKNATTLLEDEPKKMILNYTTNPGTSYIASKMDDSAITKIKEEVSATVTKTYAKTIFNQISTVGNGMNEAADGSKQINDGTNQLIDGNNLITTNLKTLADSTLIFDDGARTLSYGLSSYLDGVSSVNNGSGDLNKGLVILDNNSQALTNGINQLDVGIKQLEQGSKDLESALTNAKSALDKQLNSNTEAGIQALITPNPITGKTALETLNYGIQALNQSISTSSNDSSKPNIKDYLNNIDMSLDSAEASITQINEAYASALQTALTSNAGKNLDQETIANILSTIKNDQNINNANVKAMTNVKTAKATVDGVFNNLQLTVDSLASGSAQALPGANQAIQQLYTGLKTVQTGLGDKSTANTLINGANSIYQGSLALGQGTSTLNNGFNTYKSGVNSAKNGSEQLLAGTTTLVNNNPTISNGAKQLAGGANQIASGAKQLYDGSNTLSSGLTTLKDGTNTLATSLTDGAKQINNINSSDATFDMLSTPIKVSHHEISTVENNGHGMAPYMMSVGLYVACMAFTLMYPLFNDIEKAKNGFKYWLSKATIWFSISTIASVIMIGTLMLFCDFSPQQLLMTFIFTTIVGAALMALVTLLSVVCGKIGEFILLVFMVINLGGSAGTYPLETSSAIFKAIHPFIPFTYSVDGFRKVISMQNVSVSNEIIVFIGIIVICSILTILVYNHRIKKPTPIIPQAFENVNE